MGNEVNIIIYTFVVTVNYSREIRSSSKTKGCAQSYDTISYIQLRSCFIFLCYKGSLGVVKINCLQLRLKKGKW